MTTALSRPVQVLHHGGWVPGSLEAYRRDGLVGGRWSVTELGRVKRPGEDQRPRGWRAWPHWSGCGTRVTGRGVTTMIAADDAGTTATASGGPPAKSAGDENKVISIKEADALQRSARLDEAEAAARRRNDT